ncbi:hypothetical protein [Chryseobacterium sp. FH2]|uniref:hypothetical protein n=1 Tax=Chryseobacterium sp. FH2 TaxID=1674291 RepID=UPI000A6317F6|nr:hypothetical protein [Chryseobacterium sp. FH2]
MSEILHQFIKDENIVKNDNEILILGIQKYFYEPNYYLVSIMNFDKSQYLGNQPNLQYLGTYDYEGLELSIILQQGIKYSNLEYCFNKKSENYFYNEKSEVSEYDPITWKFYVDEKFNYVKPFYNGKDEIEKFQRIKNTVYSRITKLTPKKELFKNANDLINLYAFIGEKISVEEFNPNINNEVKEKVIDEETKDSVTVVRRNFVMDRAFRCKYKVIKNIFNNLPNDTVEFLAYDHYGKPYFSERDSVILYISKSKNDDHYFHQKYQYDEVFRDEAGNYFSYLKFRNKENVEYTAKNIKGFKTNFRNEKFNLKNLNTNVRKIYYPRGFYKIKNNFATPIKGIYLDELINYRLQTTFKNL